VSRLLLDTCAAIWLVEGQTLSDAAQEALGMGEDALVSPITAWEVAMLSSKSRLKMPLAPLAWFEALVAKPGIAVAELSARILVASSFLPGSPPNDPMDRIIAATAREGGYRVVTRDRQLLKYAQQGHVQALAC
jgi:PIN domain nuclease of toxin-antitoxin system